ncbi:hypothetical protein BH11PLA2_BH11PLA2_34540 [soil metagenome]
MTKPLKQPQSLSRLLRGPVSRGLAAAADDADSTDTKTAINARGGDYGSGFIPGVAIITRGEALGHGFWIDAVFLQQVNSAMGELVAGLKSRFTHPGLCSDGLGKFLGRVKAPSLAGDIVRGDLHISDSARVSPDGDLGEYVLSLAQSDPSAFGTSIVFEHDAAAEDEFYELNSSLVEDEDTGERRFAFASPDPANVNNYPHCRLAELHAVDVVDEPAANPGGLFHRGPDVLPAAEELLSYTLGLSVTRPVNHFFDINPDRASAFVQGFLARHGLTLSRKDSSIMPKIKLAKEPCDDKKPADDTKPEDKQPDEEMGEGEGEKKPADEEDPKKKPADDTSEEDGELSAARKQLRVELKRFAALGNRGIELFGEGKTFEEAQGVVLAETQAANRKLSAALEASEKTIELLKKERGEDPVSFGIEASDKQLAESKLAQNIGPNLAKLAAGIKLPGKK